MVFLLLALNIFHTFSSVSIVDFEQAYVSWGNPKKLNYFNQGWSGLVFDIYSIVIMISRSIY